MSTKPAMSVIERKREALIKAMTPATRALAVEFHDRLHQAASDFILTHYALGQRLIESTADESTYGTKHVEQLAQFLKMGTTNVLYIDIRIAKTFERKAVEYWGKKRFKDGGHMTLGHWNELTYMPEETHQDMLNRIVSEGMTAADVEAHRKAEQEPHKVRAAGAGRPLKKPLSAAAGVQTLLQLTNKFETYNRTIAVDSICAQLVAMPADKMTPALLQKMSTTNDRLDAARESIDTVQAKLAPAIDRGTKIVAKQAATSNGEQNGEKNGHAAPKAAAKSAPVKAVKAKGKAPAAPKTASRVKAKARKAAK